MLDFLVRIYVFNNFNNIDSDVVQEILLERIKKTNQEVRGYIHQ